MSCPRAAPSFGKAALDLLAAIKEGTWPQSHRRIASGGRGATLGLTTMGNEPGLSTDMADDAGLTFVRLCNQTLSQETPPRLLEVDLGTGEHRQQELLAP